LKKLELDNVADSIPEELDYCSNRIFHFFAGEASGLSGDKRQSLTPVLRKIAGPLFGVGFCPAYYRRGSERERRIRPLWVKKTISCQA
jgi:hypothetical protein